MPITVNLEGVGTLEFPDGMSEEQINKIINRDFGQPPKKPGGPLTQTGIGVAKGVSSAGAAIAGAGEGLFRSRIGRMLMPGMLADKLADIYEAAGEKAQGMTEEVEQLGQQTEGPEGGRKFGTAVGSLAPTVATGPLGIAGMAGAAGLQSFGGQFRDSKSAGMQEGLTEEEASSKAMLPSVSSGIISAVITRAFPGGTEAILKKFGANEVRKLIPSILKSTIPEATEETIDQAGQLIVQKLSSNPNLTWDEAKQGLIDSGLFGGILGGMAGGIRVPLNPLPKSNQALNKIITQPVVSEAPLTPETGTVALVDTPISESIVPAPSVPQTYEIQFPSANEPKFPGIKQDAEVVASNLEPISSTPAPTTKIEQAPEPEMFNTVDELLKFRETRLSEERSLFAEQIGITGEQAKRLQDILDREASTSKFEKSLTPEQFERFEKFFDGPFNQKSGPFKSWETDRRLNPEEIAAETDPELLSSALLGSVRKEMGSTNSDQFAAAVIAAIRLKEVGGTKTDIAKYLDKYSTRESSSQGDKAFLFKSYGQKIASFLKSQGIDLPDGGLGRTEKVSKIFAQLPEPEAPSVPEVAKPIEEPGILVEGPSGKILKWSDQPSFAPEKQVATVTDKPPERLVAPRDIKQIANVPASNPPTSAPSDPPRPPVIVPAGKQAGPETVRKERDYSLHEKVMSPQFVFGSGNLGENAQAAWETMQLAVFDINHSVGKDVNQYVDGVMQSLPKPMRKSGAKAFYEVLDGRDMTEIQNEWANKPGGTEVINAATQVKGRLEEIRVTIRDTKANGYRASLSNLDKTTISELYQKNVGDPSPDMSKAQLIDGIVNTEYTADWGISDGSYLPHLFSGTWKITVGDGKFVNRAKTVSEAKALIYDMTKQDPTLRPEDFKVEHDTVIPDEVVRLGDKQLFRLINSMKEELNVSASEIKEAQSGIIGRKASKKKWFGHLQRRTGNVGYSKDFEKTMSSYLSGFHRWKIINEAQQKVVPLIDKVKSEGRPDAAKRLEGLMDNLWGKPAKTTTQFDNTLTRIPVVKDFVQPLALDRWMSRVKSMTSTLALTTPRFWLVNRLQPLQGLYPIVGERLIADAKIMQHTAQGRALLDSAGVTFDPGQYSTGVRGRVSKIRERLSGERSNQELGFLAVYLHGINTGLSQAEAVKYGKLRGQLATQFTPSVVDNPEVFEGPIASTVFQFKRFPVKQLELTAQLGGNRSVPGIVRMLSVYALTGGLSFFLRQAWQDDKTKRLAELALKEELGETGANAIMYGMPGLLGADISASMVVGDEPYGKCFYEKVGRFATGPAVSFGLNLWDSARGERKVETTDLDRTLNVMKSFPATKQLVELYDLAKGNKDVTSKDGRLKYEKTLKDTLMALGSFKSANISSLNTAIGAYLEVEKESQEIKNDIFVNLNNPEALAKAERRVEQFNNRWPEKAILPGEINDFINDRMKTGQIPMLERMSR